MYEKHIDLTKAIEYTFNTVFEEIYYFEDENNHSAEGVIYLSGDNKEVKEKFNLDDSINNIYDITKAILDNGKTIFCLIGTIADFGERFSIKTQKLDKRYKITSDETLVESGGFGLYIKQHDGKYVCRYGLLSNDSESPHEVETFKPITKNYEKDIMGKDVIEALDSLDMYYFWDIVPTVEEVKKIIKKTKHAKINIDNTIFATERSGWMEDDYFVLLADGTYLIDAIESEDEEEYIDDSEFIENNLEEGIYIALAYACPDNGSTSDIDGENGTGVCSWKDNNEYSLPEGSVLGHMEDDYGILVSKKDDEFEITFAINESFRYGPGFGYRKISSIEDKLEEPLHRALIKMMYDAIIFEAIPSETWNILGKILRKLDESEGNNVESIFHEVLNEELKNKSDIEYKRIIDSLSEALNELKTRLDNN